MYSILGFITRGGILSIFVNGFVNVIIYLYYVNGMCQIVKS